jgi:TonB family protein
LQTVEYRGFAAQFPERVCRFIVTWRWPLLFSLLLHAIAFWPASPTIAPIAFATKPALSGHLQATPSPDLPEMPRPDVSAAGQKSITKTAAANKSASPPISQRDDAVSAPSASTQLGNIAADAGGLRAYRVALARALGSGTWRSGLDPQLRGSLEIGIAIDASGRVREIGLVRGSGQTELDRRLLEAVRMAVREAVIPSVLQSQSFFVALPIDVGEPTSVADR